MKSSYLTSERLKSVIKRISDYIRDLQRYASPIYYSVSTNSLGGIIFGVLSGFFNPRIRMPETPQYIITRAIFGVGAGVAYSLGAFIFTLPHIEKFTNSINNHVKNEVARDLIYGFLSIATSLAALIIFAYFLFIVYGGYIPVTVDSRISHLIFPWFVSSLVRTNWAEIALIPLSGTFLKESLRELRKLLFPKHS